MLEQLLELVPALSTKALLVNVALGVLVGVWRAALAPDSDTE